MAKKFSRQVTGYMQSILAFLIAIAVLYLIAIGVYALTTGVVG